MEGVIVQGLLQFMESSATVIAREKDGKVAEQAAEAAAKSFKEISGRSVKVDVDASLSNELYVP